MLELSNTLAGVFGFTSKAIVAALGTSSRNSSKRFGPNAPAKKVTPVMLFSGRLRLLTSPRTTGSLPTAKTMGIVCVAAFAASAVGLPLHERPVGRDGIVEGRRKRVLRRTPMV